MTTTATDRQAPAKYPGEFIRVVIGSTIHGLSVPGTDDLDLMGVKIERPNEAIGLGQPFQQHVFRTQPEGTPSGSGDVDLTVYSLRKYLRLVADGNPTLINLLFVPQNMRVMDSELGCELRGLTSRIISRQAAWRYKGYLRSQRERLIGERGQKRTGYARRLKYLSEDGWDTKYAMHMIRLGVQGVELMQTGRIELPMTGQLRDEVYDVRLGKIDLPACVEWAEQLESQLETLAESSHLPVEPDRDALEKWLVKTYLHEWTATK